MLAWPILDKSYFSGLGTGLFLTALAIIGFFIRRALKKREDPAKVIVQLDDDSITRLQPEQKAPAVPIDRISPVKPKEIRDAISNALPIQRSAIEESYVGIKVEWDAKLSSAEAQKDGTVRLVLKTDEVMLFLIFCYVKLSDYRELGVMPEGSKIRMYGEIKKAELLSVELKDVELKFLQA
jgi:hypothetical protein